MDHPHAKAAYLPVAQLGGIEHPRLVFIKRAAHEAAAIGCEGRLEFWVIFGLGFAQQKPRCFKCWNTHHRSTSWGGVAL